jgi:hypothetical protein
MKMESSFLYVFISSFTFQLVSIFCYRLSLVSLSLFLVVDIGIFKIYVECHCIPLPSPLTYCQSFLKYRYKIFEMFIIKYILVVIIFQLQITKNYFEWEMSISVLDKCTSLSFLLLFIYSHVCTLFGSFLPPPPNPLPPPHLTYLSLILLETYFFT